LTLALVCAAFHAYETPFQPTVWRTKTRVSIHLIEGVALRRSSRKPNDLVTMVPTGKSSASTSFQAAAVLGGIHTVRYFTA